MIRKQTVLFVSALYPPLSNSEAMATVVLTYQYRLDWCVQLHWSKLKPNEQHMLSFRSYYHNCTLTYNQPRQNFTST